MNDMLSVLLIEDDKDVCQKFSEHFDLCDDIELIGVTNNSTKAIEHIKDFLPNVVILDLELHCGNGTGLDVLRGVKDMAISVHPFFLITTNNSSSITYDCARNLGADFIMYKHQSDYCEQSVIDFIIMMKPIIRKNLSRQNLQPSIEDSPVQQTKRVIRRIIAELNNVGISPKVMGYQYLIDAIAIIIEGSTHNLCNLIGEKHNKTESSVERAIQNAINKAWRTSDIQTLLEFYTAKISSEKGVPTITEFVYYYANKIKNEYR